MVLDLQKLIHWKVGSTRKLAYFFFRLCDLNKIQYLVLQLLGQDALGKGSPSGE